MTAPANSADRPTLPSRGAVPKAAEVEDLRSGERHGQETVTQHEKQAAQEAATQQVQWTVMAAAVSTLIHAVLVTVLGCWFIQVHQRPATTELVTSFAPRESAEPVRVSPTEDQQIEPAIKPIDTTDLFAKATPSPTIEIPKFEHRGAAATDNASALGSTAEPPADATPGAGGGLAGLRSASGRQGAIEARGGNAASEAAVERALQWFIRHQQADGTWNLEYRSKACKAECDHPGLLTNGRVAATSLALLPFLGAGHTHRQGSYQKQVSRGLKFLERIVEQHGHAHDPNGGGLYAHALATIVLCEAYAMTGDRALLRQSQRAIYFIAASQDPIGGGWRYVPGQPGDTSAVGWQLMALKSGHLSYIRVSPQTVSNASRFLDSVQLDDGASYGYLPGYPESRDSTTAIGVLCRMIMGTPRDDAGLVAGVKHLSILGPSKTDLYYDYYATQVLHHYEGPLWQQWNAKMRDQLILSQVKGGHAAGSWYVTGGQDDHNEIGGRLYCTSLATMTLEVYYRYMPLYQVSKEGIGGEAPALKGQEAGGGKQVSVKKDP